MMYNFYTSHSPRKPRAKLGSLDVRNDVLYTDREPCWSCENSMTWFVRSRSWRFGILLLRKSSSSWLRFDTSFIPFMSLQKHITATPTSHTVSAPLHHQHSLDAALGRHLISATVVYDENFVNKSHGAIYTQFPWLSDYQIRRIRSVNPSFLTTLPYGVGMLSHKLYHFKNMLVAKSTSSWLILRAGDGYCTVFFIICRQNQDESS